MDIFLLKKGEHERKYKGECDETRTEQKKKNRPTKKDEGKMSKIPECKIKMEKGCAETGQPGSKTKGHHGKAKGQNQKASIHKQAKQIVFLSLPHSIQKYKPTFSPNVPTFRDFLPSFSQKLPTPTPTPIQSYAQDTRLRVYTHPRTQRICHFYLHPSPRPATDCRSIV